MSLKEEINKLKSQLSPAKQKLLEKRLLSKKEPNEQSGSLSEQSFANAVYPQEEIYVYNLNLSTIKNWVLDEHRILDKATLPGTAYLDMARSAFENHFQNGTMEMKQIYFLMPLIVEDGEEKVVRTILKKQGDSFEFLIASQSQSNSELWHEHAKGKIASVELQPPRKYEISELESRMNPQNIIAAEKLVKVFQSEIMDWRARWHNCQWVKLGINQGLALLELPEEFTDDLNFYKLHPALLDSATGFLTLKFQSEEHYLPFSYKKLRIQGTLPRKIYSYSEVVKNSQPQEETLTFNIRIMDEQGEELVAIEEYTLRKFREQQFIS